MCKKLSPLLVTGGAGFIGSEFVRLGVRKGYEIIVIDKLTYAGDLKRLAEVKNEIKFYKTDICSRKAMESILEAEAPAAVVNFAAETHVDRSIRNPAPFIDSNVKGVRVIMDVLRSNKPEKFIHISTDEVYGEKKRGSFSEKSRLCPSNPYAASKAAADLLVSSYAWTYAFPGIIVRPCNNYGPGQYPEKLIPLSIMKVLRNEKVSLYGDGRNLREWLYVSDCAKAVFSVLEKGKMGEVYNAGSGDEKRNIDVVKLMLKIMGKSADMIEFVKDRLGHDFRYSLNSEKISRETGWQAETAFEDGLEKTIAWHARHFWDFTG